MIEIFGSVFTISEVLMIFGFVGALVASHYRQDQRLQQMFDADNTRGRTVDALENRLNSVEKNLASELASLRSLLDTKMSATDDRLRTQDVFMGRLDERFNSMSIQLDRLIELAQRNTK